MAVPRSLVLLARCVILTSALAGSTRAVELRLATFTADVTPPIGHPCMGGGIAPVREILDPLSARGIVLLGAGQPIVIVGVDWCEIRNDAYDRWRSVLADAAGTAPARVLVSALHQHDAPVADLEAERLLEASGAKGRICDLAFHERAVQNVARALKAAIETARPVTHIGTGQARVEQVASNRRYLDDEGKPAHGRMSATRDPALRAKPEGTIDPFLRTLSFWEGERPLAALSFYATHPMSYYGRGEVSSDFVGLARNARQEETPGVLQIYLSGCSGNVTAGKYNDGSPENRPVLRDRIHRAMKAAWESTRKSPVEKVEFRSISYRLAPRDGAGFTRADLERRLKEDPRPFGQCLAALGLSWRKRCDAGQPIDLPVVDFGSAVYALLPGEAYVEFQLKAQQIRPDAFVVVAGYGECAPGYVPIERAFQENDSNLHDWCWVAPGAEKSLTEALESALRPSARDSVGPFPRFPALDRDRAVASFRTRDGFRMTPVATEPLVIDPVAAAFDEDGRLYVVEMSDYPYVERKNDRPFAENTEDPPIGRVRILVDRDDDGRFDEAHLLVDKLSWPTGVAVWKGGVFVAATPDIWYFKDTDGDFMADIRKRIFTGFRKYNIQAVMNNLVWGLDHGIYGAGSGNGGEVRALDHPDAPAVPILRRDFRIDPVSTSFEAVSGGARFGNTFDDWGNRFLCDIRNPAEHVVLPARYLARNPNLLAPRVLNDAAEAGDQIPIFRVSPPEPWRELRARRWSEIGKTLPRSELVGAGVLTSSSGVTCYRGDAYPDRFRGNLFLGEVANNVIHRMVVEPDGVTFRAHRAADEQRDQAEFIASTDTWFRPVNFLNAPDGTLYILDMYREYIEHPWSIPDDIKAQLDLRSGEDRGRIYRLEPPEFRRRPTPRLGQATTTELVALLEHPNAWHRETAQRLLFERQDPSAVEPLRRLLVEGKSPRARLASLWSLQGLNALEDQDRARSLDDPDPHVREHAVLLSESRIGQVESLRARVLALAGDPAPRVRLQVAFSLGELPDTAAIPALARLARSDANDKWIATAIESSVAGRAAALFGELVADPDVFRDPDQIRLLERLVNQAARGKSEFDRLRQKLARLDPRALDPDVNVAADPLLVAIAAGLERNGLSLFDSRVLPADLARRLSDTTRRIVQDPRADPDRRARMMSLLGNLPLKEARPILEPLMDPGQPESIRLAAARVLGHYRGAEPAEALVSRWAEFTPLLRRAVLELLLNDRSHYPVLLKALTEHVVSPGEIPLAARTRLLQDRDPKIQGAVRNLFGGEVAQPRREVVARYQAALKLETSPDRGRVVFDRECLSCHKLGSRGHAVGPNLASVQRRTPDELLLHILDPNREVAPDFLEYVVSLKDGRVLSGIIESESSTSLTLKRSEGVTESALRADIEQIKTTGKSLMPEGLEAKVSPQELADLISYLLALHSL